jgi:hypothetical protein
MNTNLKDSIDTLTYLKLYTDKIQKLLVEITELSGSQVIDFDMFDRGLRKVLLKKGDKKKKY